MKRQSVQPDGRLQELIRFRRTGVMSWSQHQAGRAAGISSSYWRRIEAGGRAPAGTLGRMLHALHVRPAQLDELGYGVLAELVQAREDIAAGGDRRLPPFVADKAEAHLWETPGLSRYMRRELILHLRTLREAEADPVARALLGPPG